MMMIQLEGSIWRKLKKKCLQAKAPREVRITMRQFFKEEYR
jgi:hypothetical protein